MASFFRKLFSSETDNRPGPSDFSSVDSVARVGIAVCAIMVEVARADDDFTSEEHAIIVDSLKAEFDLSDDEAGDLISIASRKTDESIDTWGFTHTLNESLSEPEKIGVIEAIWKIIFSDGRLGKHEDTLIHKLSFLLGLTHQQMIAAKMKMLEGSQGES